MSSSNSQKKWYSGWESIVILILLVGGYQGYKYYSTNNWSAEKIERKFKHNLAVFVHSYAYKAEFVDGGEPAYFIKKPDGSFDIWDKNMEPNFTWGCGLLINQDGECVSTLLVAQPWKNDFANEEKNLPANSELKLAVRAYMAITDRYKAYRLSGFTIKMGYYFKKGDTETEPEFIPCNYTGTYYEYKVSAFKPAKAGRKFEEIKSFLQENYQIEMKPGKKIFALLFPENPSADYIPSNLKISVVPGELLARSEETYSKGFINYSVASAFMNEGAPIINRSGQVIGIYTKQNEPGTAIQTNFKLYE